MAHAADRRRERIEARAGKLMAFLRDPDPPLPAFRRLLVAELLRERRAALDEAAAFCGKRHRQHRAQAVELVTASPGDVEFDPRVIFIQRAAEAARLSRDIAALKPRVARRGRKRPIRNGLRP